MWGMMGVGDYGVWGDDGWGVRMMGCGMMGVGDDGVWGVGDDGCGG